MKKLLIAAALVIAAITVAPVYADMDSDLADAIDDFSGAIGIASGHPEAANTAGYQRFAEKSAKWKEIEHHCYNWARLNYRPQDEAIATRYCLKANGVPY